MCERFGKSPAKDYLGILDESVALQVDLAAWGVLAVKESEAMEDPDKDPHETYADLISKRLPDLLMTDG